MEDYKYRHDLPSAIFSWEVFTRRRLDRSNLSLITMFYIPRLMAFLRISWMGSHIDGFLEITLQPPRRTKCDYRGESSFHDHLKLGTMMRHFLALLPSRRKTADPKNATTIFLGAVVSWLGRLIGDMLPSSSSAASSGAGPPAAQGSFGHILDQGAE